MIPKTAAAEGITNEFIIFEMIACLIPRKRFSETEKFEYPYAEA
jgi:hypothetical protein